MSDTILDARGPYAVQMAGGAGSSLRTQTQIRNAHCEEPRFRAKRKRGSRSDCT